MELVPTSKGLRGRPFHCSPMSHLFSHPIWNAVPVPNLSPSSAVYIYLPLVLLLSMKRQE